MTYNQIQITLQSVTGIWQSLQAARLSHGSRSDSTPDEVGAGDLELARKLILAGDDHAQAMRGIHVHMVLTMCSGFFMQWERYRVGKLLLGDCENLTTSSQMHTTLKKLTGVELAEQKQNDLPGVSYTEAVDVNYQALRRIYFARRNHAHPDWRILCGWIETLPYFAELIAPARAGEN